MNKFLTDINLSILLIIALLVGLVFAFKIPDGSISSVSSDFSDGWYYDSTSESSNAAGLTSADPMAPEPSSKGGWMTISKQVNSSDFDGADLCFSANNMFFDVYLDDELIYNFEPELLPLFGECYGGYIHTINIPNFEGSATLSIKYQTLVEGSWSNFRNMRAESGANYLKTLLYDNFGKFILSCASLFLGIILVACGIFMAKSKNKMAETVALGTMTIVLACYTHSNTILVSLVTSDPAILRLIEHLSLVLLPAPAMIFAAAFTDNLNSKLVKIILSAVGIDVVAVLYSLLFNLCDYHYLLPIAHITIGVGVIFLIVLFARDLRQKKKRNIGYKYLAVAFGILVLSGIGDLVTYYLPSNGYDAAASSRYGLLIFTLILLWYEVSSLAEINRKSAEAEVMNKLAHVDTLTGLGNRTAFDESEQRVGSIADGKCVFVQLDVNLLKKVNDTYGHLEGDKHLVAAATSIRNTFGKITGAECFRTGGDEFFVIIASANPVKDYNNALTHFLAALDSYNKENNPPVPLSIAYGMAEYSCGIGVDPHIIEKLADDRMYVCKKALKAKLASV